MGRGLVIGSTRLFAAAECILAAGNSLAPDSINGRQLGNPPEVASRIRTRAPTALELSEARAMLVRMGFHPIVADQPAVRSSESLGFVTLVRHAQPRLTQRPSKESVN